MNFASSALFVARMAVSDVARIEDQKYVPSDELIEMREEQKRSRQELTKIREEQKRSREQLTKIREEQKRSREVGGAPAKPHLADLDIRLRTFKDWPADSPVSPRALAKAGFYHDTKSSSMASASDCCRCFHCGVRIANWNADDDPFVEHARLSPTSCPFVKQCEGEAFIQVARKLAKNRGDQTTR